MSQTQQQRYIPILHTLLLAIAVITAYYKVFGAGFMSWDDAEYVVNNKDIQNWTGATISNWFREFYVGNYHPLTMLSYATDYLLGKQEPFVYHFTNILLHIANATILYFVIDKIQEYKWVAFFVALLFAIHPVQTETVSWIAERKNVLYAFFFLLSMLAYTAYLEEERRGILLWVYLAGCAAMLSKPAAVALPAALLALDVWLDRPLSNRKIWIEKLPLFLAAIVAGIIAIYAQDKGEFLNQHTEYQWYHTLVFAGYAYVQYIVQLVAPLKLSVLYPYPDLGVVQILFFIVSVAILFVGYIAYKRKRYILSGGILFYTVNIALVLQFVQFGEVLMADRYLYLPCIGIWLPIVYYAFKWSINKGKETAGIIVIAAVCLVLLAQTNMRNEIWLSEMKFWEAIVETFPNSSVAQNSVGGVYMKQGNYRPAQEHIDEAVRIDPGNYKAWYNKGVLHLRKGEYKDAADALDKCLQLNEYTKALFSRALLYQQVSEPLRALNDIDKVLAKEPNNARAYFIRGNCLAQNNNYEQAILSYNKAIEYGDGDPVFYLQRGVSSLKLNKPGDAINDMSRVIDHNPNNAEAWYWRGLAKQQQGQEPCHDLNKARNLGYKYSEEALVKYCND